MSTQSNLLKRLRISVLMVSVLALLTFTYAGGGAAAADSMSDKWLSPAPSAAKKNPIAPTQDSISGRPEDLFEDLYDVSWEERGRRRPGRDRAEHSPGETLRSTAMATESDGSLFWKISTGKKPMPAYGKRLSETDRWNLVNYIRTLSKR